MYDEIEVFQVLDKYTQLTQEYDDKISKVIHSILWKGLLASTANHVDKTATDHRKLINDKDFATFHFCLQISQ